VAAAVVGSRGSGGCGSSGGDLMPAARSVTVAVARLVAVAEAVAVARSRAIFWLGEGGRKEFAPLFKTQSNWDDFE
jgi:hypothetical protein